MNLYPARTSQMYNSLQNSANYIKQRITHCEISIICDSDYDFMVDNLENSQIINYADIPNFPSSTGSLHYGNISNKAILCWINRLYCYEGYSHYQSAYISHLTAFLGVHTNLVLNSSDLSMNNTSDIVFLTDYIKQSGEDPLDIGLAAYLKTSLQVSNDQTQLIDFCIDIGQSLNIDCTKGVYLTYRGPSFPTPYEIENYSKLGADVLTTNSIVEYLAGKIHGLRVMVLSVFIKDQYALWEYLMRLIIDLPVVDATILTRPIDISNNRYLRPQRFDINGEHIMKGIEWLRQIDEGNVNAKLCLVINSKNILNLSQMRKVYYKEIPNFPQESLASMKGHVIFGTIEKTRVVCLVNCDFEGLDVYEAYYLVQVLIGLGIRHLHYVFPVVNYITALHGIDDYLNFKLQGCAEVQSNDACTISSLGNKLVIGLPGPGLPSPSEIVMCASYNLDFITISNFAILNEAGNRGLSHSASCFHSNLIDDSFSIDSLTEYLTSTNYFSKFYVKSSISFPFFHANSDLDQLESPENSQDLEDLAVEIKTIYDPNKAVIVSDSIGDLLLRHFTVIRSFAFGTFFPQTFHFTEDGVMIIKGSPILKHKDNHYRMMFPTFMVNRLGIDNVIIIEEASTCSSLISVGTWAKISDMGGFVSFNPLNGPNQSSWGSRFPKMAGIFTDNEIWKAILNVKYGVPCKEAKMIYTNSARSITGRALSDFSKKFGAGVIGRNGPYSVIITQHRLPYHAQRKILYLCWIDHDPISEDTVGSPPMEHQIAIKDLILQY